jgi:hypothetical protein
LLAVGAILLSACLPRSTSPDSSSSTAAPRFLIQRGFGNGLLQHLPVEPEGARLFRGQRTAEAAAELLQLFRVDLAKLLGRNLGLADRGERRLAEPLEDVGDTPDCETDDQNAHHGGHDNLAEPV